MAHERVAIESRGVSIIAISPDEVDVSRSFAKRYGIQFSLVSDEDLVIARKYVGVDDQGYPRPGVVIVRMDGSIHLRQIANAKDDRIYAPQLIAALDTLPGSGKATPVPLRGGFAAITRRQLAIGILGGAVRGGAADTDTSVLARASLAVLQPVLPALALGVATRLDLGHGVRTDLAGIARLRRSIWADQGELYVQLRVGGVFDLDTDTPATHSATGLTGGIAVGSQFAWFPGLAIYWQVAADYSSFAGEAVAGSAVPNTTETTVAAGAGVSLLF